MAVKTKQKTSGKSSVISREDQAGGKNSKAGSSMRVASRSGKARKDFTQSATYEEYVRTRAYYIWLDRGRPEGEDNDIWMNAEKDIRRQMEKK